MSYLGSSQSSLNTHDITFGWVGQWCGSVDSVIASDSLVINNLKKQINIEEQKIDNLQETVKAYEQKENILTEEINNLTSENKKLDKQKKRRNHALVVTSTVAILSTFVLSILL